MAAPAFAYVMPLSIVSSVRPLTVAAQPNVWAALYLKKLRLHHAWKFFISKPRPHIMPACGMLNSTRTAPKRPEGIQQHSAGPWRKKYAFFRYNRGRTTFAVIFDLLHSRGLTAYKGAKSFHQTISKHYSSDSAESAPYNWILSRVQIFSQIKNIFYYHAVYINFIIRNSRNPLANNYIKWHHSCDPILHQFFCYPYLHVRRWLLAGQKKLPRWDRWSRRGYTEALQKKSVCIYAMQKNFTVNRNYHGKSVFVFNKKL